MPAYHTILAAAARFEVQSQITRFRREAGCHNRDIHVAHIGPREFRHLLADFLVERNLNGVDDLKFRYDYHIKRYSFKDREVGDAWQAYHKDNAILELQHASVNLRTTRNRDLKNCLLVKKDKTTTDKNASCKSLDQDSEDGGTDFHSAGEGGTGSTACGDDSPDPAEAALEEDNRP